MKFDNSSSLIEHYTLMICVKYDIGQDRTFVSLVVMNMKS